MQVWSALLSRAKVPAEAFAAEATRGEVLLASSAEFIHAMRNPAPDEVDVPDIADKGHL